MSTTTEETTTFLGTGRRKTASARVRLTRGSGKLTVNGKTIEAYLADEHLVGLATAPLKEVELAGGVDAVIKVQGGGPMGQSGAISHGLARALQKMDPELRAPLKKAGFITRDGRMKERKKPGQPGARKRFQFSKR